MEVKVFLRRSGAAAAPGAHSTAGRHRSSAGSRLGTGDLRNGVCRAVASLGEAQ